MKTICAYCKKRILGLEYYHYHIGGIDYDMVHVRCNDKYKQEREKVKRYAKLELIWDIQLMMDDIDRKYLVLNDKEEYITLEKDFKKKWITLEKDLLKLQKHLLKIESENRQDD